MIPIKRAAVTLLVLLAISIAVDRFWPYRVVGGGYAFIQNDFMFDYIKENTESIKWYQDKGGSAVIIQTKNGGRHMVHDGYSSLYFDVNNAAATQERLTGTSIASLMKPSERESALVIGYGTGITVGAAAQVFAKVKVFEIRSAMIEMATKEFSEFNFNAHSQPNVEVKLQDGIVGLAQEEEKYSAIMINVPSPGIRGAEKIYATETLRLIRSKLKKNGLVFAWMHGGQGPEVLQVLMNNVESELGTCRYFFLDINYFQSICAPNIEKEAFLAATPRELGLSSYDGRDLGFITRISEFKREDDPTPGLKSVHHSLDRPWFDTRALFTEIFGNRYDITTVMKPLHRDEYCQFIADTGRMNQRNSVCQ